MKVSSFDIFDTCLIRKCGTPENFFDVFSFRVFNGTIEEWERQEFVAVRRLVEKKLSGSNPYYTLQDIWANFSWEHPLLKSKEELCILEQELEREMLVPVLSMRDKVNDCRKRGDKIIFISDMYLSSEFLISVMRECGFYQDGDSLYVSCECKARKSEGDLFHYVRDKEGLKSFSNWHHYSDNKEGDYKVPKKLGIRCTFINHEYTPYQKQWKDNDYSLGFKYPSILAGIGRALHYSTEWNTHTDFVLDIIAPFYCSLVYRMMKDAEQRGIKRLYFCARDAYMMYLIAQKYAKLFPSIEALFLYISRTALYDGDDVAKIAYYKQIGLATKDDYVGIVDIRSSGRTLVFLNDYLSNQGYLPVRGYYYELFCQAVDIQQEYSPTDYYIELSDRYDATKAHMIGSISHVFETFFPLNTLPKTIDYTIDPTGASPIFEQPGEDSEADIDMIRIDNKEYWAMVHQQLISSFADAYLKTGLYYHSDNIFDIASTTLFYFIKEPQKHYLQTLQCLQGKEWNTDFLPYVRKESWIRLLFTRGKDSLWKQGTLALNNFTWFQKLYQMIRYE
ncbi:MAG: hypothetical protein IJS82_04245 [Paludibacteraceae bacterium]|nr:hypothetical protein [Paludibacteraceae bacterium]